MKNKLPDNIKELERRLFEIISPAFNAGIETDEPDKKGYCNEFIDETMFEFTKKNITKQVSLFLQDLITQTKANEKQKCQKLLNSGRQMYQAGQANERKEIREWIYKLDNTKFPRGERKWCIECFERIKKEILNKYD